MTCETGIAACVGICVISVLVFCVCFTRQAHAADPPVKDTRPKLIVIFSADYCEPCHRLHSLLKKKRVPIKHVATYTQPAVGAFPTCYYEIQTRGGVSMVTDNGGRIINGDYRLPEQPVEIIEYITRGSN